MSQDNLDTVHPNYFCADLSRDSGEPMAGTAPAADAWLLLEYGGPWTAKATEDNDLPLSTQAWLAGALALTGKSRLQFIKQNRPSPSAGVSFFVALPRETSPLLYQFRLDDYGDLGSIELPGLLAGERYARHLTTQPLYLVCTNGRRDRCCSRLGLALYQELRQHVGGAAWQTTHLGGHRFAPTLVAFPGGACYGRLAADDLAPLVQAQEAGQLYLSHLRGRCCYDGVVQAAEYFLRRKSGLSALDAYRLLDVEQEDEALWAARFTAPATNEIHRLVVSQTLSEPARLVSCSPAKDKPVPQFQLVSSTTDT